MDLAAVLRRPWRFVFVVQPVPRLDSVAMSSRAAGAPLSVHTPDIDQGSEEQSGVDNAEARNHKKQSRHSCLSCDDSVFRAAATRINVRETAEETEQSRILGNGAYLNRVDHAL